MQVHFHRKGYYHNYLSKPSSLSGGDGQRLSSRMNSRQLRRRCILDADSRTLLQTAMEELGLSTRDHGRTFRVARTIADLDGSDAIRASHLTEAIGYRSLDRKLWAR